MPTETNDRLLELEALMNTPDFWSDKDNAQKVIAEYQALKEGGDSASPDEGKAVISFFAGAGGLDAEDFTLMLRDMYRSFAEHKGWGFYELDSNENDHGGLRSASYEIRGKGAYGILKNESGVHRLVRISPFNAQDKRQTSFAMVEVVPPMSEASSVEISPQDLEIEFTKGSGPGGQNVNKRETAVRITHKSSGLSVIASAERTQEANRIKAMEILRGKLYHMIEQERKAEAAGMAISKTTSNEWGSQIRSYVLHPYKLVKDHRTNVEVRDTEAVLSGSLDKFIEAEQDL